LFEQSREVFWPVFRRKYRCSPRENSTELNYWNLQKESKFADLCQFFDKFINLFEKSRAAFWLVFSKTVNAVAHQ
jgi:hypothetical protein